MIDAVLLAAGSIGFGGSEDYCGYYNARGRWHRRKRARIIP